MPPITCPSPLSRKTEFPFQTVCLFKSKDSGIDIKCQPFFCCQKENHSFKSIKIKGQMPVIKLLGFLFWFERVWHFKQPFLFHSFLLAGMDCLFQMPVIDIKHKVGMTSIEPVPSCVLPVLYSLTICFTQAEKFRTDGSHSESWLWGPPWFPQMCSTSNPPVIHV